MQRIRGFWKQAFGSILGMLLLVPSVGCSRHAVQLPATLAHPPADNSYLDLTPGSRLRILLPIVKADSGEFATHCVPAAGSVMVCSAPNLIGYQILNYSATPSRHGNVRLQLTSAATTINGQTVKGVNALKLPFPLPVKAAHVRLVYLLRSSRADHNMAMIAARNPVTLNVFTEKLKANSSACKPEPEISCTWVPLGISVGPDSERAVSASR